MNDLDTTRTYTAAELAQAFGVSLHWVHKQCRDGKTLRGYRLSRTREHGNAAYRYQVERDGEDGTLWLACHDMTHVDRYIPVAVYSDELSARECAQKERYAQGPGVCVLRWSGVEPETGVYVRAEDDRIEQVLSV